MAGPRFETHSLDARVLLLMADSRMFVFFDVGGTLLGAGSRLEEVVETALFARRIVRSGDAVAQALGRARAVQAERAPSDSAPDARAQWNRNLYERTFCELALEDEAKTLAETVWGMVCQVSPPVILPGARAALELLKDAGAGLGVISNWDESLPVILAATGIAPYLDVTISSSRIGCAKPDRTIFEAALSESGAEASRAWHVGDDLRSDVEGAVEAGLRAVLLGSADHLPQGALQAARVDQAAYLILEAEKTLRAGSHE
jgi:FMN phosphatase YigB (HAD superfamily)